MTTTQDAVTMVAEIIQSSAHCYHRTGMDSLPIVPINSDILSGNNQYRVIFTINNS